MENDNNLNLDQGWSNFQARFDDFPTLSNNMDWSLMEHGIQSL